MTLREQVLWYTAVCMALLAMTILTVLRFWALGAGCLIVAAVLSVLGVRRYLQGTR